MTRVVRRVVRRVGQQRGESEMQCWECSEVQTTGLAHSFVPLQSVLGWAVHGTAAAGQDSPARDLGSAECCKH
jgi:hypothetical protein